jgi:hypothetical protein
MGAAGSSGAIIGMMAAMSCGRAGSPEPPAPKLLWPLMGVIALLGNTVPFAMIGNLVSFKTGIAILACCLVANFFAIIALIYPKQTVHPPESGSPGNPRRHY